MTTPNKCEHQEADDNTGRGVSWVSPIPGGAVCDTCGARFIPSDVLEEVREAFTNILTDNPKLVSCLSG